MRTIQDYYAAAHDAVCEFFRVSTDEQEPQMDVTNQDDVLEFFADLNEKECLPFAFEWLGNINEPTEGGGVITCFPNDRLAVLDDCINYSFDDTDALIGYLNELSERYVELRGPTIGKVRVENMTSPRGNREVPNQFIIHTPEGTYFQSYSSVIAFAPKGEGKTVLDASKWDYSTTTGKYRNNFLGESIEETRAKIKNGTYILADLN